MNLRAVVVDDEQLAREDLCFLLEQLGDVEVVAQAGNGAEALAGDETTLVRSAPVSRYSDEELKIAPPKRSSFSVRVVLPASGCEMMAKVRRRATSSMGWVIRRILPATTA